MTEKQPSRAKPQRVVADPHTHVWVPNGEGMQGNDQVWYVKCSFKNCGSTNTRLTPLPTTDES